MLKPFISILIPTLGAIYGTKLLAQDGLNGFIFNCTLPKEVYIEQRQKTAFQCVLKNTSKSTPLVIEQLSFASPGCEWERSGAGYIPLLPGKSGILKLVCNIRETGAINRSFNGIILLGSERYPIEGRIHAQVLSKEDYHKKTNLKPVTANLNLDETSAIKNKCNEVRLDGPGGSMEFVKPKFQIVGNCYAHAASQMYDAWRFKKTNANKTVYSSPFEIGNRLNYTLAKQAKDRRESIDGGLIASALEEFNQNGSCPPLTLNGRIKQAEDEYAVDYSEQILTNINSKLSNLSKSYNYESDTPIEYRSQDSLEIKKAFNQICADCGLKSYQNKNFKEVHSLLQNLKPLTALNENIKISCDKKDRMTAPKFKTTFNFTPKGTYVGKNEISPSQANYLNLIHSELSKGSKNAFPIGIS